VAEFGALVTGVAVEAAAMATLRTWMNTYVGEASVQSGYARIGGNSIARPTDIARASQVDWRSGDKLPLVLVVSVGLADDALRGPQDLSLTWELSVVTVATGSTRERTRTAAQVYAAAAGMCLLQKGVELDGFDPAVDFISEFYRLLDERDSRSLMAAEAVVRITVPGARSLFGGPVNPTEPGQPRPPGQPGPTVLSTQTTVDARALDADPEE
jgi:hypothetical protein